MLAPSGAELVRVDYAPQAVRAWPVSTQAEEGLDPALIAGAMLEGVLARPDDLARAAGTPPS